MVLSSGSAQPDSVLLLPPSNTQNNNDGSLYPSVHDMEEDGSNKDDSDDIASSNIIPAASIASNTRKRYGTGLVSYHCVVKRIILYGRVTEMFTMKYRHLSQIVCFFFYRATWVTRVL